MKTKQLTCGGRGSNLTKFIRRGFDLIRPGPKTNRLHCKILFLTDAYLSTAVNAPSFKNGLVFPLFETHNVRAVFFFPLLVCTWFHGGHVGDQEQKHFSPLEIKLYFHVNSLRKNSIVYWPPTWTWLQTKNSGNKWGSWSQTFLAEIVETGNNTCMFCEESLGKMQ